VPRLAPGLPAAATHGVLRTAHAIRALSRAQTEARLAELAHGLGYWAARYQELPGAVPVGHTPVGEAWVGVPPVADAGRQEWLITDRFAHLPPSFAAATAAAELPASASDAVSALTQLGARMLITNPHAAIPFVHAVTAPSSLRSVAALLDEETTRRSLGETWITMAALWSAYGEEPPLPLLPGAEPDWPELIDRAIVLGDEHGLKLTVAAGDEVAAGGDPALFGLAVRTYLDAMAP
jgi:hypothetical protein